jgi:hypothetical protein
LERTVKGTVGAGGDVARDDGGGVEATVGERQGYGTGGEHVGTEHVFDTKGGRRRHGGGAVVHGAYDGTLETGDRERSGGGEVSEEVINCFECEYFANEKGNG